MITAPRVCRPRVRHGGFWNADGGGREAEAVRVPLADGTLVTAPVEEDSPLIPSLLTLSDVYGTGYHAAIKAGVSPRTPVGSSRIPAATNIPDPQQAQPIEADQRHLLSELIYGGVADSED